MAAPRMQASTERSMRPRRARRSLPNCCYRRQTRSSTRRRAQRGASNRKSSLEVLLSAALGRGSLSAALGRGVACHSGSNGRRRPSTCGWCRVKALLTRPLPGQTSTGANGPFTTRRHEAPILRVGRIYRSDEPNRCSSPVRSCQSAPASNVPALLLFGRHWTAVWNHIIGAPVSRRDHETPAPAPATARERISGSERTRRADGDRREERQIEALQRMYRRVLADEDHLGAATLKKIDAAVRGDASDE